MGGGGVMGGGLVGGGEEVGTDQTDRQTASRKTPDVTGTQRVRSRDSARVSSFICQATCPAK